MKINKLVFLMIVVIGTIFFAGCESKQGKENNELQENPNDTVKNEAVGNETNVKAVIKALSDSDLRFPAYMNDEGYIGVVATNVLINGVSYGFDDMDNETGISVYAFAEQNGLNEEQRSAISQLLSSMAYEYIEIDDKTKKKTKRELSESYPDDFSIYFPYIGADIDYMTISSVDTEPSGKGDDNLRITADVTLHFHLIDGTEKTVTEEYSVVPETGNTPLDEKRIEQALNADKMNERLPNEERSFYEEKK